ncbi:MAG: L,D-transpeptidase family protein [Bacteroidetes bacterium]|nr:L,D-transpeptidase family protein [Bacteroidota bacterium]
MKPVNLFILILVFSFGSAFSPGKQSFEDVQKTYSRVYQAYKEKEQLINERCEKFGIPPERFGNMYIRVFKEEREMEVWLQRPDKKFVLFNQFRMYGNSGTLGPKREEGDRQIPEGCYHVSNFNPFSNYHLSLGINYPNESDRMLSTAARRGGSIFIHGSDVSIGCIAMSDDYIEDIYIVAVKARNQGQTKIPVHIFPFKPTAENMDRHRGRDEYKVYHDLWTNLAQGYQFFEKNNRLPEISVNSKGYYEFADPELAEMK